MVLVPPDAAIRMRMQTEANLLQQVQPVRGIPSDLPELQPGQTFSARIQPALPDNTYRALVAGKQLTLQLPEGAKPGDQLDLVVIDRSAKVVIARQVEASGTAAASNTPYAFTRFSDAARLIGQLLPAEGKSAPSVPLNRGQPLLVQMPQGQNAAALLAPALGKAVTQSGVFYEAHQAQWVSGRLPLAQLLQEPQGQRSTPAAFAQAAAEQTGATPVMPREATTTASVATTAATTTAASTPQTSASQPAQPVPNELRPLVQQQLEAAASNRVFWHGEVWPRQTMEWEIEWDGEREADGSTEADARWRTALALTTPRLGRIDASLQLTAGGVRITLATPQDASAAALRAASLELAQALAAAGVPLRGFKVNTGNEYPAGQG
jgi:flagellar hook-length control protein FliK